MTMDDADIMLEWKNYPETRKFAIKSHEPIEKEAHYDWLSKNLIWFRIIENQNEPIGAIRIFGSEISIWIDRRYWGFGIATKAIQAIATDGMYAKIVNGNVASFRAFIKAGFVPVNYSDDGYYILKK